MTRRLVQSNRRNSAKSTGPKSPQGEAASARNAVKHGLSGTPELSDTELIRFGHLRRAFSELLNTPEMHEHDIHECAISQVLLERIIALRHRAHSNDSLDIHALVKLRRFENRLTKQRDRLLRMLNPDEYTHVDQVIWNDSI